MKRLLLATFLILACPILGYAQGSSFSTVVLTNTGRPVAGASVTVCIHSSTAPNPCTNLATIYGNVELSGSPITNPTKTDGYGNITIYASPGTYDYTVAGNGITTQTYLGVTLSGSGGGPPSNPTTSIQFNNTGAFGGSSAFTYVTATGNESVPAINNILYVDGVKYTTLANALAACLSPGCVVYDNYPETFASNPFASLPSNVFAEVHMERQTWVTNAQIVVPNKSQLLGAGRGDANTTGTVIQAGSSFPSSTAVLEMGSSPIAVAVRIENLTVDCNNKTLAIGIQNFYSQEQSAVKHVLMANCPTNSLDIETSSAENSGPYEDIESLNQSTCTNCSAGTIPVVVKNVGVFRGIHGATINSMGAISPTYAMEIDSEGTYENIHFEYVTDALIIGSQQATSGVTVSNIECGPSTTNCVLFSNSYSSQNLVADSISASTGNLIEDLINTHTLAASTEGGSVALYAIGNGATQSVLTTSVSLPQVFGAVTIPSLIGAGIVCLQAVGGVIGSSGSPCVGSGNIGGSGIVNYLPKFTAPTTLSNSTIQENGVSAIVPESIAIKGPDPFIDISSFMPLGGCSERAGTPNTATVMSSSTSVAVTGTYYPAYFNGCGVMIEKAGPTSTISAPTGLAATSHGSGGSTTIKYSMVAIDNSEGYSPASSTLTFTTSDTYANLTTRHYNFIKGFVVTNAVMYCTYSDKGTGGSLVAIGCDTQPTYRDQGANHNFNLSTTFPPTFLPTNPPGSNGPQALFTTIVSGGGTTTWTVANAASNTATNVSAYHDISVFVNDVTAVLQNFSSAYGYNGEFATILCPAGNYTLARWPLTTVPISFKQACALNNINLPYPIYAGTTWDGSSSSGGSQNFLDGSTAQINMSDTSSDVFSTTYAAHIKRVAVQNQVGPGVRMMEGGVINLEYDAFVNATTSNNCAVIGDGNVIIGYFDHDVFTAGQGAYADGAMCWSDQTAPNTSSGLGFSNDWFIERAMWVDNPGRSSQSVMNGGLNNVNTENSLDNGIVNVDSGTSAENSTVGGIGYGGGSQDNTRNASANFATVFCYNPENIGAQCEFGLVATGAAGANSVRQSNPNPAVPTSNNLNAGPFVTFDSPSYLGPGWSVGASPGGGQTLIGLYGSLFPANVTILGPGGNGDLGYSALLPAPFISAIVPSSTGGTLPAGTYYYVATALDSAGEESAIGPENSATVTGSTSEISMTAFSHMGFQTSCVRIYRGTAPGMETGYIGAVTINGSLCTVGNGANALGYVDTNSVSLTTATPPTISNAYWMRIPTDANYPIVFGIEADTGGINSGQHKPIGHGTFCVTCVANGIGFDEEDGSIKAGKGLTSTVVTSIGTAATLTGTGACLTADLTTQKGGAWAGSVVCTNTTGSSTLIITTGSTAANGWSCSASDLTTANTLRQSASSTSACTISGTVNANDVLTFTAIAF